MPQILSPEELHEIKEIIAKYHSAMVASLVGADVLSPEDRAKLEAAGITPEELNSIEDSYLYGQVLASLENPAAAKMSYDAFKKHVQKNPIPLTPVEQAAVRAAKHSAGTYIQNLGMKIDADVTQSILQQDAALRAQRLDAVREQVAESIARREGLQTLRRRLGESAGSWNRDWMRVAVTEKAHAMQQGQSDYIQQKHGDQAYVFKRPMPDACPHCLRLHIGPDGHPRIFRLSELHANGHNAGRKAKDWLPTVAPVHPWCQCVLQRVPPGWGFNEAGELVPGGTGGQRYQAKGELERSLRAEDELQKAHRVRGHLDYRGLPIAIENPAGSVRKWRARDGTEGQTTMLVPYGYVEGTMGPDGDEYDVFVGPDPRAEFVFVVHQAREDSDAWDEDKAMVGFSDVHAAQRAYLAHYTDPSFLQSMSVIPFAEFAAKVLETGQPGLMQDGMVKARPWGPALADLRSLNHLFGSSGQESTPHFCHFYPEGADLQKGSLNPEHAAEGSQWGNRAVWRGTSGPNLGFGFARTPGENAQMKAQVAQPAVELAEIEPTFVVPIKDPHIYQPGETQRVVKPVEPPAEWKEAQKKTRARAEHNTFLLTKELKRKRSVAVNYADVERGNDKKDEEEVQKAAPLAAPAKSHKYIKREWMNDHWIYTYAQHHKGKVEGHTHDPDAVVLKLPKEHLHKLQSIAKTHKLQNEPFVGGKYALLQVTQAEANKLRQVVESKKPKEVQKLAVVEAKQEAPKPKPTQIWKGEPVEPKDLQAPVTKLLQDGQPVQATIAGKAVEGHLEGWDYAGRAVIREASGARRIASFSKVQKAGDKLPVKRSYDGLQKEQIVRATEQHQKLVSEVLSEQVLPGHSAQSYLQWLNARGVEAYLVGGVVRDLIAGTAEGLSNNAIKEKMRDVDIVGTAPPTVALRMFEEHPVKGGKSYNRPGGVWSHAERWGVVLAGGAKGGFKEREEGLDYAAMVSSGALTQAQAHPDTPDDPKDAPPMTFDHDIRADARRRDFSINSLYYDASNHVILDPTGHGIEDAQQKHLRVVAGEKELAGNFNIAFRFWKFRIRGYTSDKENIAKMRASFEHFATNGTEEMAPEQLILNEALRACGKVCKTPEEYLQSLRNVMTADGCADLYDKHIFPMEKTIIQAAKASAAKVQKGSP